MLYFHYFLTTVMKGWCKGGNVLIRNISEKVDIPLPKKYQEYVDVFDKVKDSTLPVQSTIWLPNWFATKNRATVGPILQFFSKGPWVYSKVYWWKSHNKNWTGRQEMELLGDSEYKMPKTGVEPEWLTNDHSSTYIGFGKLTHDRHLAFMHECHLAVMRESCKLWWLQLIYLYVYYHVYNNYK